jgi:hypothetical protein
MSAIIVRPGTGTPFAFLATWVRDGQLQFHGGDTKAAALAAARKAKRAADAEAAAVSNARIDAAHAEMRAHVARGTCPTCGAPLKANLSITGWWQCAQLGAVGFRRDAAKPSCDFQGFTE